MRARIRDMLCAMVIGAVAFGVNAATDAEKAQKADYNAVVAKADADYKAAKEACNAKQGNDKDVCLKQAQANHDKVVADAKATRKSNDAVASARDTKMEAQYKVAKEKCDSLSGDAKDACVKQAKQQYGQ